MRSVLMLVTLAILLVSCAQNPSNNNVELESYENQSDMIDPNYKPIFNEKRTHILYIKAEKDVNSVSDGSIDFFIYDRSLKKILLEEKNQRAKVFWLNNSEIEIKYYPGNIREGENPGDYIYTFDIRSGKKKRKSHQKLTN